MTPDSPSMLDAKLEVYDSNGQFVTSVDDPNSNTADVTLDLPAGTYYAVVESHGNYADIGPYGINIQSSRKPEPASREHQRAGGPHQPRGLAGLGRRREPFLGCRQRREPVRGRALLGRVQLHARGHRHRHAATPTPIRAVRSAGSIG